jgi:molybdenum cofactor synthesis domain-containing protein
MTDAPRAELLSIGAELLLGETVDTNAAHLGAELARLGLPLASVRMLPDDRAVIAHAFAEARGRSALVLATGGLGPTHDDLSREGLADALDEALSEDPALLTVLVERFGGVGTMPSTNRRQALRIPSAEAVANPIGSAPGWWVDRDGSVTVLMPGVPSEMRRMWAEQIRPRVEARFGLPPLAMRTVKAFGIGESAMAERLGRLLTDPPEGVEVGIYARDDGVHVRFSTRGDAAVLEGSVAESLELLGDSAYGTDEENLPTAALARLARRGNGRLVGGRYRRRPPGDPGGDDIPGRRGALRRRGSGRRDPQRSAHGRCRHPALAACPGCQRTEPGAGRALRRGGDADDRAAHPRIGASTAAARRLRRARRDPPALVGVRPPSGR